MKSYFATKQVDSPQLVAEMLLAHVIGCERMRLYMEVDRPASPLELSTLRELVKRAGEHEPVQYLVGHAWFFGKPFEVNRSTLIPRPSTETLVEHVIDHQRATLGRRTPVIADLGTGTGCIAVTLAMQIPGAHVIATDVVPDAIELAKHNAEQHKVSDRIEFRLGSGIEPLRSGPPGQRFDYICSNPPYISDSEWAALDRNVREYEPATALRGGAEGLDVLRPIIDEAGGLLAEDGQVVLEIGSAQHDLVLDQARAAGFSNARVLKDHEGLWRVLVAEQ